MNAGKIALTLELMLLVFFQPLTAMTAETDKNVGYLVARACRFSPWGVAIPSQDLLLRAGATVSVLLDEPNNGLPMVRVESSGQTLLGFIDRGCLDPGPLSPAEWTDKNAQAHKFVMMQISPSIQSVIHSKQDARLLGFDPAPIGVKAYQRILELQQRSDRLRVDSEAIREVSATTHPAKRFQSLAAFLLSTQIELGELISRDRSPVAKSDELNIGAEALLVAYDELANAQNPQCEKARNAFRLFYATGMRFSSSDQVLALYSMLMADDPKIGRCATTIEEARTLTHVLQLPTPESPYVVDQAWKKTWGVPTDEQIKAAFPGKRVRVIRDDGDFASEKRIVAALGNFGTLEKFAIKKSGAASFRWIQKDLPADSSRSSEDLRRSLRIRSH